MASVKLEAAELRSKFLHVLRSRRPSQGGSDFDGRQNDESRVKMIRTCDEEVHDGRLKKYWREVIGHDMEQLQFIEDMTLDRKAPTKPHLWEYTGYVVGVHWKLKFLSGGKVCSNLVSWHERIEKVELTVKDEKRWKEDINSLLQHCLSFKKCRLVRLGSSSVPLSVVPGKPVKDPFFQESPKPIFSEAMASCPKEDIPNFKELLQEENFYLTTEEGGQGLLPVLVMSVKESDKKKRPTIVFLHSTHKCKEWLRPLLEVTFVVLLEFFEFSLQCSFKDIFFSQGYASRGYIAVAIDSRYHGERATSITTYRDVSILLYAYVYIQLAYTEKNFPLWPLMQLWAVENFDVVLNHVMDLALVSSWKNGDTMPFIFDTVWDLIKLADYLTEREDVDPSKIGITGESLGGMHAWFAAFVDTRYSVVVPIIGVQLIAQPGIGHRMTPLMVKEASDWFDRFLKHQGERDDISGTSYGNDLHGGGQPVFRENPYRQMILDAAGPNFSQGSSWQSYSNIEPESSLPSQYLMEEYPNSMSQFFFDLLDAADAELYLGSSLSQLTVVSRMLNIKMENNISQRGYNQMTQLLKEALPEDNIVLDNYYQSKKLVRSLGLPVEKIDCCESGSADMRWHYELKKKEGLMRHPSDSEAWKHFKETHPFFAVEPRNVRMGL
ncbi:putative L-gulonolactone oxidase-like [Capsicum annuum]|nr:putative L-gulonolactone oxidase-like [Capsicum annuum]